MREVVNSSGSGDFHLGWLVPGETVCIGAGPVSLRYSRAEAEVLCLRLQNLLEESPGNSTACGCASPEKPRSSTIASFWEDAEAQRDLPNSRHRVAGLG
jgi:hypothetical protein